jgi:hypothetical protein
VLKEGTVCNRVLSIYSMQVDILSAHDYLQASSKHIAHEIDKQSDFVVS